MKKFKSLNRAMKRGHVDVKFSTILGQTTWYFTRSTNRNSDAKTSKHVYNF